MYPLSRLSNFIKNARTIVVKFHHSYSPEDYLDYDTAIWDASLDLGYNNTSLRTVDRCMTSVLHCFTVFDLLS